MYSSSKPPVGSAPGAGGGKPTTPNAQPPSHAMHFGDLAQLVNARQGRLPELYLSGDTRPRRATREAWRWAVEHGEASYGRTWWAV